MYKKSALLPAIVVLLVAVIGVGIWVILSNRQTQEIPQTPSDQTKTFSMEEVVQHKSKHDCWTIISGDVYDLTEFINRHPGGDEIQRACGVDATTLFNSRQTTDGQPVGSGSPHSDTAREQLAGLKIGTLIKE